MKRGDFVRFKDTCPSAAGKWCAENGITGMVVEPDTSIISDITPATMWAVETGLPYTVFVHPSWVDIIANSSDAPVPAKHE